MSEPGFTAKHPPVPTEQWKEFTASTNESVAQVSSSGVLARQALVVADAGNGAAVSIGPDSQANLDTIAAGSSYSIDQAGRLIDLSSWNFKSVTNGVTVSIRVAYVL